MSEKTESAPTPVLVAALLARVGFVPVTVTHHDKSGDVHMPAALDLQSGASYSHPEQFDQDRLLMVMVSGTKIVVDAHRVLAWAAERGAFAHAKSLGFLTHGVGQSETL